MDRYLKSFIYKIKNPLYLDLTRFDNFTSYFAQCDVDVRTSYNKYIRNNFEFRQLNLITEKEQKQLYDIWTSTATRQGRTINLNYETIKGEVEEIKEDHWPIKDYNDYNFDDCSLELFVIYKDGIIVAYLELIFIDNIAIVHSTLGHFDYLKFGIMKALFVEVLALKWKDINKLIYGSVKQKDYFKSDLLIKSYNEISNKN